MVSKQMKFQLVSVLMLQFSFLCSTPQLKGDEGMYLFNDLPAKVLQDRYGFDASEDWANQLRLSSVRFNSGGSGSFISSNGLVLTNHHVASDTLHKLSTPQRNLIDDGYLAKSMDQELKAPDLELNQLVSIEDVTARVEQAVDATATPAESAKQRRAIIANIEKESLDATGYRSDVVTLFGGAKYHLIATRSTQTFAWSGHPETEAAFFGGDADNFEYPRYNLDATIMRVYEDGKPAEVEELFASGTFCSAKIGRTRFCKRQSQDAHNVFLRLLPSSICVIRRIPYLLDFLASKRNFDAAIQFGGKGSVSTCSR